MSLKETEVAKDPRDLSLKHKLTYWYLDHIFAFLFGLTAGGGAFWWLVSAFTQPGLQLYTIITVFGIFFGLLVRYGTTILNHWLEK